MADRTARLIFACGALGLALSVEASAQQQAPADAAVRERRAGVQKVEETKAEGTSGGEDDLRRQLADETRPAERARLQRELVERAAADGRKAEAVALLREMLAEERFDPPFFYNVGNTFARLDEPGPAAEAYRKAISQRRGNYARAQHNLGVVLTRLGRWEEAEAALTAAVKLENFNYPEASYSLGRLYALRGEAGLAIEQWANALRLKPDHEPSAVALARALAEDGDPPRALKVLDDFAARAAKLGKAAPREVEIARGEIVAASNVAPEEKDERPAAEPEEKRPAAVEKRPAAKASARPVVVAPVPAEEAVTVLRAARVPSKPRQLKVSGETYNLLLAARRARSDKREEEAVELYRAAVESGGGYLAPANMELGFTLEGLRRNEEAAASLFEVVRNDGARYPIAFYHLGRYYEHLGRLEQSAEAFARAAELLGHESPQFYIDLSRVREKQGRYREALAAVEEFLRRTEPLGTSPHWARRRLALLKDKTSAPPKR
ncbi:MAG TPA: tetratricopeptide repeat protein [Pyrinomonadaceae bacterium]|jgi:tetratricopeptide (TPR) repeat protein|nr:tetratricopeptide repeat protein [Pyrinomonadaceae bacterium]